MSEHLFTDKELNDAAEHVRELTSNSKCPFCSGQKWLLETVGQSLLASVPRVGYVTFDTRMFFEGAPAVPVLVYMR